jgi:5'-deoxynucleotidase YfbR-like HD superfamily hydrolase
MTDDQYDELAKQAFNCIVTFFLASIEEHAGNTINWTLFPKIALYRAFQKAYVLSDISESTIDKICEIGGVSNHHVKKVNREIIVENTNDNFAWELCEAWNSKEARIFRAATKIATYIEFVENRNSFNGDYAWKLHQIVRDMKHYEDIEGFDRLSDPNSPVFKMLETISKLRNQNRWAYYARALDCSVLGHLFDTAIFAYFMALEQDPKDEERATRMFFIGLFHDIPEGWTKDIPSPIKDRINGFRKASELYEVKMVEENLYSVLPDYLEKKVRDVMMEDGANADIKPLLKGADYLSASSECLRNLIGGTRDFNFYRACLDLESKIIDGKVIITDEAHKFYYDIVRQVLPLEGSMVFYNMDKKEREALEKLKEHFSKVF